MIGNLRKSGILEIISLKDSDEKCLMHSKSSSKEIRIGVDTEEIISKLFDSLLPRYQVRLEQLMKGGNFTFACVKISFY